MQKIAGVSGHAREQMIDRYGFDPPPEVWLAAVRQILDRTGVLMAVYHRQGKEKWRLVVPPEVEIDVVWSPLWATIVTVLPAGANTLNPARQREREAKAKGLHWTRRPYRRDRRRVEAEAAE